MTDKSDCPYQRKTAYQEPCYICGLGIRRELRADCPYHKLQRNLDLCGREMKALYGERDELFELQSKAALIEHAVDKATESLSVEKAVNAALRKRIADLEAERDRLHGVLSRIANDGCGCSVREHDLVHTCRDLSDDEEKWCWCCIAAAALEGGEDE